MATKSLGTTLTKTKSGSETEDLVIGGLTSIGEVGVESDEIDVTTLDFFFFFFFFIVGSCCFCRFFFINCFLHN